ncbi:MAG: YjbQ family protein [Candidatus Cloacimonadota bacterium]|nr:MAG: YjbQ family protein [Candidatus Cloacimonadota bacterium]
MMQTISVSTKGRFDFVEITHQIREVVRESGVKNGICVVYAPHTTAGITINEGADFSVRKDILKELDKIIPLDDNYSHLEGNSAAHIKSSIIGCSEQLIIENGDLVLGTWQSLYFCEFDGPRNRKVYVKIIEE